MRAVLVVAVAVAAGCAQTAPRVTPAMVAVAETPEAQRLSAGREAYVVHCSRCHRLYQPSRYSESEWRRWVALMSPRAGLTSDRQAELCAYLLAARRF